MRKAYITTLDAPAGFEYFPEIIIQMIEGLLAHSAATLGIRPCHQVRKHSADILIAGSNLFL